MRWLMVTTVALGLAGCGHEQLWPGPGDSQAAAPVTTLSGERPAETPAIDAPGIKVPRTPAARQGSGTPPDQLFPDRTDARRPPPAQAPQAAAPPAALPEPRNDVINPRDPMRPYSADGFGYQRQGSVIVGPTGETYNRVGSSLIGPGGRACQAVGNSVIC